MATPSHAHAAVAPHASVPSPHAPVLTPHPDPKPDLPKPVATKAKPLSDADKLADMSLVVLASTKRVNETIDRLKEALGEVELTSKARVEKETLVRDLARLQDDVKVIEPFVRAFHQNQ
jgi:hypothetical protein